jgi:hypothetical protein
MVDGAVAISTKKAEGGCDRMFEDSSHKQAKSGQDIVVPLSFSDTMIEAIDAWAVRNSVRSRSDAIRMMIDGALNDRRKSPRLKLLREFDESDGNQEPWNHGARL